MKNFWKVLAILLIGGLSFETIYYSIRISSMSKQLVSAGVELDERDGIILRGNDYIKSVESGFNDLRELQASDRAIISELRRENESLRNLVERSGELNSVSYERYERLQGIFRELADRATEVKEDQ